MEIAEKYSHLNGEEFLIVHHKNVYEEIIEIIQAVEADKFKTKVSKEKTMPGKMLYNPDALNREFKRLFKTQNWEDMRYSYYVTTNYTIMQELITLPLEKQKEYLIEKGVESPVYSYKQTDFVKDNIAIEVQFGKYAFVAYDLFVKHLLFYSGGVINVGIEVLPMKSMQSKMSTGIAYYEGEVYNILRHGRNNPPVPLVILGITP
ncbi:restriction endonuclease [candidate division KSB1 bacterium]|nr:restriction endonuclease [candidate division KSB1 bacterium]NIR68404.1 restriction endonuclease [candidate division KSB1 bacterium]NIS22478.1 restriction endonuclease [candidate division KSB1 bacterium]NIT69326.1 restriction endonuclease [candidate division KSB1 bacterium]NIU22983.1 restriction endonuclease [candidate division KSB1 bacterium]